MLNNNTHIGIVGAGNIGSSIYQLIVSAGFDYKLSIADITDDKHWSISDQDYVKLNVPVNFDNIVEGKTLIINALPFSENINLYKSCCKFNVPYFDLSEDCELDKYISDHMGDISRPDIPFTMAHCGLAPGMSSVIANNLVSKLKNPKTVKIRVGALSQNSSNKLRYYTSWSGEGLVNEYIGDCEVIRRGEFSTEQALSGYEKLTISGKEYEAFNTSGGVGSLARTLSENSNVCDLDYKTVRRIGHYNYVDFLFNDLQLSQESLTEIFKSCIPKTRKDLVILYASASGEGSDDEHTYCKIFKPQTINGRPLTAIEYTTAIGVITMVELFLTNQIKNKGYVTNEEIPLTTALNTTFGKYYREHDNINTHDYREND